MEIGHETISTVILLPSANMRRVVLSYKQKYVHKVLVNCLVMLVQKNSVVWWNERPYMAISVDWDVKQQPNQNQIFTFPLRVFKWNSTFEMWFIPSWTIRFKPHLHTRHLGRLTSNPSNNVACLLTFAWRWTRIAMTLSAEIWHFGCSEPYVMSDLIQNIWKPAKLGENWKLILNW